MTEQSPALHQPGVSDHLMLLIQCSCTKCANNMCKNFPIKAGYCFWARLQHYSTAAGCTQLHGSNLPEPVPDTPHLSCGGNHISAGQCGQCSVDTGVMPPCNQSAALHCGQRGGHSWSQLYKHLFSCSRPATGHTLHTSDLDLWLNSSPFWLKNHFCSLKTEGVTNIFWQNYFSYDPMLSKGFAHATVCCSFYFIKKIVFTYLNSRPPNYKSSHQLVMVIIVHTATTKRRQWSWLSSHGGGQHIKRGPGCCLAGPKCFSGFCLSNCISNKVTSVSVSLFYLEQKKRILQCHLKCCLWYCRHYELLSSS